MKTLLLATILIFSHAAFSGEAEFRCEAQYFFGDKTKATLTGLISNSDTLSNVVYTIDDQTVFSAQALYKDKNETERRFAYYKSFKVPRTNFTVFMPERLEDYSRITAIIGNGKTFDRLECEINN